jgi:two-component system, chemotaxis family, protein-glutamate methylesterase/glutaminase
MSIHLFGLMAGTPPSSTAYDVVALASSAGGLKALSKLLAELPADFPVPILVVQHLDRRHPSWMADILGRHTALRVKEAEDGEALSPRTVYVAPPDHHLLVRARGTLSLTHTELVHFVRPSADLLFESVASSYGDRSIVVVLTGSGSDGAVGAQAVKKKGGMVIAQDEASCQMFGMPGAAIRTGSVDRVLPLDAIAGALVNLVTSGEPS